MLPITSMIKPALLILVPLTLGVTCKKFNLFEPILEKLYQIVVIIILPALVFGAVAVQRPPGILSFGPISALALIGIGVTSIVAVIGAYLLGLDREKSTEIFINAAFMNYTFLGLAVVQSVLGAGALGKASIYAVTVGVIHLTIGLVLTKISAGKEVGAKEIITDILSFPAAFALIVAILFVVFEAGVPFWNLARSGYDNYANLASFLMVLATGYKMEIGSFRKHLSTILGVGSIRLVLAPIVTLVAITVFKITETVGNITSEVALILSIMPPGVFNIILAERFDLDIESYGSTVFYLTIISLFVGMPILIYYMFPSISLF